MLPDHARDFRAVVGDKGVSISPRTSDNQPPQDINRTIAGETYALNAERFFQTNVDLLPQLIDAALRDARGESALELYCGVGLFNACHWLVNSNQWLALSQIPRLQDLRRLT